jgi:hypothetical protein
MKAIRVRVDFEDGSAVVSKNPAAAEEAWDEFSFSIPFEKTLPHMAHDWQIIPVSKVNSTVNSPSPDMKTPGSKAE